MDSAQLEELERLHKAATPGPWVANNWGRVWYTPNPDSKRLVCDTMRNTVRNPKKWRANARLIASMREAVPELIAENRALLERAQMRQELVEQYEKDIASLRQKVRELERKLEVYSEEKQLEWERSRDERF